LNKAQKKIKKEKALAKKRAAIIKKTKPLTHGKKLVQELCLFLMIQLTNWWG
jgi:hypothetical protein